MRNGRKKWKKTTGTDRQKPSRRSVKRGKKEKNK